MFEQEGDEINLRECIKLRNGPFNGVTIQAYHTQQRIMLTMCELGTMNNPPVYSCEYQRNSKPQFTYIGRRLVEPAEALPFQPFGPLDESDRREGFEDGLHRAINVLYDHINKYSSSKNWKTYQALVDIIDEIRDIGEAMGFNSDKLYRAYEQEKEHDSPNYMQRIADRQGK